MNLFDVLVYIAIAGVAVWLILQLPLPAIFRNAIVAITCLALVIWILQGFGLIHGFSGPRMR